MLLLAIFMNLFEVGDIRDSCFSEAMKIYLDSFPANERQSIDLIKKRFNENRYQLFVGTIGDEVAVFSLIYRFKHPDFYLLDYYAVKANYRDQKLGTDFLKALFNEMKLNENKVFLILEVEDPNYGNNRKERTRRVQFYKSLGVRQIESMRYILPPLDNGKELTDMIIMIYPAPKCKKITCETLVSLVNELYIEKYNRSANDPLFKKCLELVPKKIRFI